MQNVRKELAFELGITDNRCFECLNIAKNNLQYHSYNQKPISKEHFFFYCAQRLGGSSWCYIHSKLTLCFMIKLMQFNDDNNNEGTIGGILRFI